LASQPKADEDAARFDDDSVAAAMIDRFVYHAEIINIKADSYRLKDRDLGRTHPPARPTEHPRGSKFNGCRYHIHI
jgi:hypothetical protein